MNQIMMCCNFTTYKKTRITSHMRIAVFLLNADLLAHVNSMYLLHAKHTCTCFILHNLTEHD